MNEQQCQAQAIATYDQCLAALREQLRQVPPDAVQDILSRLKLDTLSPDPWTALVAQLATLGLLAAAIATNEGDEHG